jgi:hypothetical protein
MAHTWIRRPDLVLPPVIERSYLVGPVIEHMKNRYFFVGADVRATIQGSLRCDGGQIRDVTTTFRVKVMVPIDILMMAMGQLAVVWWLKAFWWGSRGVRIIGGILRKERFVERKIQEYVDKSDLICLGQFDLSAHAVIVIDEPIWLDENYRPMIVLHPWST